MPSLSFVKKDKADIPVAIVKGGKQDKEILYLHDETILGPSKKARDGLEEPKEGKSKVIKLTDGQFEIIPSVNPTTRQVYYCCGQSGSGKSYIAKTLAEFYHKLYPGRGIYLISKLEKDDTLDSCKFIKRIPIASFLESYPDLDEFKDTLTIWDDYDTLTGDAHKVVHKIIDDLAIQGRHTNSSMICCTHYLSNFKLTRLLLNEITHFIVYPMSTAPKPLKYLLETYVGVDPEDFARQKRYGSRWLCYKRGFPIYCISQTTAEVLFCD